MQKLESLTSGYQSVTQKKLEVVYLNGRVKEWRELASDADKVSAFKRGELVLVLLGNESPINKLHEFLEEVW